MHPHFTRAIQDLTKAMGVIATPGLWTASATARNAAGDRVQSKDPGAVCWCITGALVRTDANEVAYLALRAAAGGCFVKFNDEPGRTHAQIIDLFQRAIELAADEDPRVLPKNPIRKGE